MVFMLVSGKINRRKEREINTLGFSLMSEWE